MSHRLVLASVCRKTMKYMLLSLALGILFSASMAAQTSQVAQSGLAVQNVQLDPAHHLATISLLNGGDRTITAFTISVAEVYQNGGVHRHELTEDYGPNLAAVGKALIAGQIKEESDFYSEPPNNPVVHVETKVVAVICADQTAEGEREPLQRIVTVRKGIAAALDYSAKSLEAALNNASESHPVLRAAEAIRATAAKNPPGMDAAYLQNTAKNLEDAAEHAAAENRSERDLLQQRLAQIQEQAALFAAFSEIKEQQ